MNSRKLRLCSRSSRDFTDSNDSIRLTEKCRPNIAQEIEVVETVQPFGVVQHHGPPWGVVSYPRVTVEDALHPRDIRVRSARASASGALVGAETGIAHLGRAAAHQRDRAVWPGLLPPAQQHDVQQVAHMQRPRRRVIADVAGDRPLDQRLVEALQVGAIGEESARG